MKKIIWLLIAALLCISAVACGQAKHSDNTTDAKTVPNTFDQALYEEQVDPILREKLLHVSDDETINITIYYYGPSEEEIEETIEERWQIMKDIQSGSVPSQETAYTLPTEGDGIRNSIALNRGVRQELHLKYAQVIIDEFFPNEEQIIYAFFYTSQITARATKDQIRALSQSSLVSYIEDYDSNTTTACVG